MTVPGPISQRERLLELDVLRGFALFGILCVNMTFFRDTLFRFALPGTVPYDRADAVVSFLLHWFAWGKFNSLFSFLFGVGLTIQMSRTVEDESRFREIYTRRLLFLIAIGLAHGFLLWFGDVLQFYGLLGFLLLAMRGAKDRTLFVTAGIGMLIPVLIELAKFLAPPMDMTAMRTLAAADVRVHTSGTYGEVFVFRAGFWLFAYTSPFIIQFSSDLLATLMLGLWAGRRGIFQRPDLHLDLIRRVSRIAGVVGLTAGFSYAVCTAITRDDFLTASPASLGAVVSYTIGRPALMLFYVSGFLLLMQRPRWREQLGLMAWIGRMPLTNYLLQSVICTTIFYGYGFGLFAKVGPAFGLLLTLLIWMAQIPLSYWWMNAFRFGPVEWLWRSFTYGRSQPMRLTSETPMRPVRE